MATRLNARVMLTMSRRLDDNELPLSSSSEPATPLRIATRFGVVSFLNTITVFGSPNDVTLSELALEMLFPANDKTVEIVGGLLAESSDTRAA